MKSWITLAASIYPRSWREEYGKEFDALLDDVKPGWRVFANVLGGAIGMQITTGTNWLKLMTATAAIGTIIGAGVSFTRSPRYESTAVMSITPQSDPLRPTSPEALRQRAAERFAELEGQALSRRSLAEFISTPSLGLYRKERRQMPLEDVENQMRRDIKIEALTPLTFHISFSYPDQAKAQATVRALTTRLTELNATANRNRESTYKNLWQDLSAAHLAMPAPPPPSGEIVGIVDPPNLPKESVGPNRIGFLALGLLFGLLAALAIRWPRASLRLAGFAAAGFVLAAAASFLIPERYTSTAIMEITPAALAEDPLAPLPPVTTAAEFLRKWEPRVLSPENLSTIIQMPRLNLYPEARARRPMEEVVKEMLARDIRISALNPASGAFSISFSYSDRRKAQDGVNQLITLFISETTAAQRESAWRMSALRREIVSRRASEYLDVLDPPITPQLPDSPNRRLIADVGLAFGLLIGAIKLRHRRPNTPALQPANT